MLQPDTSIAERQKPAPGDLCLDHVAHFVPDLGAAAALLEALGFTATPVSNHQVSGKPAGTANRCLMFEQGYIEILAPTLDTPNAKRVREHMARYGGVHLVCFGTPDAGSEHARLAAHGFEPEPLVNLQRRIEGDKLVQFNVVYVPPGRMPEGRVQYCQHLAAQYLWAADNLAHENGVKGLEAAYIVARDPLETAARWARFAGAIPGPDDGMVRLDTARGKIFIATKEALSAFIERVPDAPGVAAIALSVREAEAFAARFRKMGVNVRKTPRGHSVALPPALGGSWLF
jgi:4-hydroxyphenylpyruvate dioxygenase-like putative hemolysin